MADPDDFSQITESNKAKALEGSGCVCQAEFGIPGLGLDPPRDSHNDVPAVPGLTLLLPALLHPRGVPGFGSRFLPTALLGKDRLDSSFPRE